MRDLTVIGRAEHVQLPQHGKILVPAKVDTGADNSSVWASQIKVDDSGLSFVLFDEQSEFYTGKQLTAAPDDYYQIWIANSFGQRERRYVVKLQVYVLGRKVRASFAL